MTATVGRQQCHLPERHGDESVHGNVFMLGDGCVVRLWYITTMYYTIINTANVKLDNLYRLCQSLVHRMICMDDFNF